MAQGDGWPGKGVGLVVCARQPPPTAKPTLGLGGHPMFIRMRNFISGSSNTLQGSLVHARPARMALHVP